jgi:hypothetical protein
LALGPDETENNLADARYVTAFARRVLDISGQIA